MARKAFSQTIVFAKITNVNYHQLIENFRIILIVLSCQLKLNAKPFGKHLETVKLYQKLYSWHPTLVTVHKILIHGKQILKNMAFYQLDIFGRKLLKRGINFI